jgi:hypothetical protein
MRCDATARKDLSPVGGAWPRPLPDFWVALLHKRLMGTVVLGAAASAPTVRVYAHCARAAGGGVALAFLNVANVSVALSLPPPLAAASRVEHMLTAGAPIVGAVNALQSKQVLLNGKALALAAGPALPPLDGRTMPAPAGAATLPPRSLGFLVFPDAAVPACH